MCSCGCPSISLAVDHTRARRADFTGTPLLPVEGRWVGRDAAEVLVFARSGWLESLELVSVSEPTPTTFPPLSELTLRNRYRPA